MPETSTPKEPTMIHSQTSRQNFTEELQAQKREYDSIYYIFHWSLHPISTDPLFVCVFMACFLSVVFVVLFESRMRTGTEVDVQKTLEKAACGWHPKRATWTRVLEGPPNTSISICRKR